MAKGDAAADEAAAAEALAAAEADDAAPEAAPAEVDPALEPSMSAEDSLHLQQAATMVVRTCMEVRRHENVLVVTDPSTWVIGQAIYEAALEATPRALMVTMPTAAHHGEEPASPVAELMRRQQVIIAPTLRSLTHTKARQQATRDGARVATMPGVTLEMFTRGGMTADFARIKATIAKLNSRLKGRRRVRVTSPAGTDLSFEVDPRRWNREDSGICNRPRMVTNLPAGKVFVMPKEGTMEGRLVIDGSFESMLLTEPLVMDVEDGLVTSVDGGPEAEKVRDMYAAAAAVLPEKERHLVWNMAEFGFGMNPQARIIGSVLEDEKNLGSCYVAIGDNSTFGGTVRSGIHVTGVLRSPTVTLEGDVVLDGGALKVA